MARRKKITKRTPGFTAPASGGVALAARQRRGAGTHGQSAKAKRRDDKAALRRGDLDN